jgi:hypothetical protein
VLEIIFCESATERECCEIYGRAILSSALRASIVSHAAINNCDCLIWRLEQIPRQMPTQKVKSHSYFINTCLLWRKKRTNWQMVQGQGRSAFCGQFVDKRNWFGSINLCSIDFSISFWSMPTGLKFFAFDSCDGRWICIRGNLSVWRQPLFQNVDRNLIKCVSHPLRDACAVHSLWSANWNLSLWMTLLLVELNHTLLCAK